MKSAGYFVSFLFVCFFLLDRSVFLEPGPLFHLQYLCCKGFASHFEVILCLMAFQDTWKVLGKKYFFFVRWQIVIPRFIWLKT